MRGQGAVHPTDLKKILSKYIFEKLFDIKFIRTFTFETVSLLCIPFSLMNLNSQKIKEFSIYVKLYCVGSIYNERGMYLGSGKLNRTLEGHLFVNLLNKYMGSFCPRAPGDA